MKSPIFFVTGTDTDVGKTFVSSLLTVKWKAAYWKPIQTGIESDEGDTIAVKRMCHALGYEEDFVGPKYAMKKPLSPLEAMEYEPEINIKISDFKVPVACPTSKPLIVEGAGGVCVPITKELQTTVDLIKFLIESTGRVVKILVVGRSGLGTLNHTLLTVEHLQAKGLGDFILGCILSGKKNDGNAEILGRYGIDVLAQVDYCNTNEDIREALDVIPKIESLL